MRVDTTQFQDVDVAWLAGLFEGEGSMEIGKNGMVRVCIRMADLDVIERVNAMIPAHRIQVVVPKPAKAGYSQPKTQYAWRVSGPIVRDILTMLLPWFGTRRAARAREVISHVDARPGPNGWQNRNKTHCKQGHEFTEENIYRNPNKPTGRHCRVCRNDWAQQYRDRKALVQTMN